MVEWDFKHIPRATSKECFYYTDAKAGCYKTKFMTQKLSALHMGVKICIKMKVQIKRNIVEKCKAMQRIGEKCNHKIIKRFLYLTCPLLHGSKDWML